MKLFFFFFHSNFSTTKKRFYFFEKFLFRLIFLQPALHVRPPTEILVIVVNHPRPRDRSGGGDSQILDLEQQEDLLGHGDAVVIYERQNLEARNYLSL